jgi:WD40 repeat protein
VVDIPTARVIAWFDTKIPKIVGGAFHPLRNWVALNSNDGILHLIDLDTQSEVMATPQLPVRIHVAAFSFDGRYLLVGAYKRYQVWDLTTGKLADSFEITQNRKSVSDLRWIPWKLQLAFIADNKLTIRDPVARKDLASFGGSGTAIHNFDVDRAGTHLYMQERVGTITSRDHRIVEVDLTNFAVTSIGAIRPEFFREFHLLGDGRGLITLSGNNIGGGSLIEVFDNWQLSEPAIVPNASQSSVQSIEPVPNEPLAVVRYRNGVVRLWGRETGPHRGDWQAELSKIQAHDGGVVLRSHYLPLSQELITHGAYGDVMLWSLKSYGNLAGSVRFPAVANDLAFSRDGKRLLAVDHDYVAIATLSWNSSSREWTGESRGIFRVPGGIRITVQSAYFSPAEDSVLVYLSNGEIFTVAAADSWKPLRIAKIAPIARTVRDSKSARVAIGAADGVYVHELGATGAPVKLPESRPAATALALSADGHHLAAGTTDGFFTSWNLQTGKVEFSAQDERKRKVESTVFTPDSRQLAFSIARGPLRLLSVGTWKDADVTVLNNRYQSVSAYAFTPDDREMLLQATTYDGDGLARDVASIDLQSHAITDFLWSGGNFDSWQFIGPDRLMVVYNGGETVAQIISPRTKKTLASFWYAGFNEAVAFDPNDNKIAASGDNQILFWDAAWMNEADVGAVRRKVCGGAVSRESLVVNKNDTRQATMLEPYIGRNVCEIANEGFDEAAGDDIRANVKTASELLSRFKAPGDRGQPTAEALREFLAYFSFGELLKVRGKQAAKAKLLAAAGYAGGIAVKKDPARAESLYAELAQAGMAAAQQNLAMTLEARDGASPRSAALVNQAAGQGFWLSHRTLAVAAQKAGNADEARRQLEKAVGAGDGHSAWLLARMADDARADDATPSPEACEWARKGLDHRSFASFVIAVDCLKADGKETREEKELARQLLTFVANQDTEPSARSEAQRRLDGAPQ